MFGLPLLTYREKVQMWLHKWRFNSFFKFLILGYGAIMLKDLIKALFITLAEDFKIELFFTRVIQLWTVDTVALTGFILGWYFLMTRILFSEYEAFYIAGIFGLFSEDIIVFLFANPVSFLFLAPLEICSYGILIMPAILSVENKGNRNIISFLKYIVAVLIIIAFSFIPVSVVAIIKIYFPELIPPHLFEQRIFT